jgi:hypothetical protein
MADEMADLLLQMRLLNASIGAPELDADGEILPAEGGNSPDPTGRYGVKAVRGSVRDTPIVIHVGFGNCPEGQPCACPPVHVPSEQAKYVGTKRGDPALSAQPKLKSKADLRSMRPSEGQSTGTVMGVPKQAIVDAPRTHPPVPPQAGPTSVQADKLDVHAPCRTQQGQLHTRVVRAEYKLARAQAEIERLKAELAALAAPAKPKKGKRA